MSRKGRESRVGVYISASKMEKKRRRQKHSSQPVMEVYVTKTKLDDPSSSKGSGGVKWLLYEARKQPHYDPKNEASLKKELATIDPNMGFARLSKGNNSSCETAQKKYRETPVGPFLSYPRCHSQSLTFQQRQI